MVKVAIFAALTALVASVAYAAPTPVPEDKNLEARGFWKWRKCGMVRGNGYDYGCQCDDIIMGMGGLGSITGLLGGVIGGSPGHNYPQGCRPNCDGNGGYDCPFGKNPDGTCKSQDKCPGQNDCWDQNRCCPIGTRNTNGICCPPGCSNKNGQCYTPPKCRDDQKLWGDNQCVCKNENYHDVNGRCQPKCRDDQKLWGDNQCICKNENYQDVNGRCQPKCRDDQVLWGNNMCKCKVEGYEDRNGRCEPKCRADQKFNGHECVCANPDYVEKDNCCVPRPRPQCRDDQKFNGHECVCKNPDYIEKNGCCVPKPRQCSGGKVWLDWKQDCGCPDGYYGLLSSDICLRCDWLAKTLGKC